MSWQPESEGRTTNLIVGLLRSRNHAWKWLLLLGSSHSLISGSPDSSEFEPPRFFLHFGDFGYGANPDFRAECFAIRECAAVARSDYRRDIRARKCSF